MKKLASFIPALDPSLRGTVLKIGLLPLYISLHVYKHAHNLHDTYERALFMSCIFKENQKLYCTRGLEHFFFFFLLIHASDCS